VGKPVIEISRDGPSPRNGSVERWARSRAVLAALVAGAMRALRKYSLNISALLFLPAPLYAEAINAEQAAHLENLVIQDCGSCHGLTRKGGLGSPLTPDDLSHAEPEGLAMIILDGVPGTAMPPWRPLLTEDEALWIANYLLTEPAK
jgi:cytochrome c55X